MRSALIAFIIELAFEVARDGSIKYLNGLCIQTYVAKVWMMFVM